MQVRRESAAAMVFLRATVVKSVASGYMRANSSITRSAPPGVVSQSAMIATRMEGKILPVPLHRPRPLPHRFRRPIHPSLQRLVERRHWRHRTRTRQRWQRSLHRFQGDIRSLRWLLWPVGYVAAAFIAGLMGVFLLFSPWTKVQEIRIIRSDPRVDVARTQEVLSPLFGRWMPPLGRKDILPLLRGGLPDLHDVHVRVSYPSRLIVRVMLDAIVARVQVDEGGPVVQSGSVLHGFLTEEGAYMQYPRSHVRHVEAFPLVHITDWGVRPNTGDHILPRALLIALHKAEGSLQRDFGQEVTERLIFLRAREFHLRTAKWWVWFDLRDSIEEHLQRYHLFLQSVPRETVREYVDLRPLDRVVYR